MSFYHKLKHNDKGFTLVELILTVVILALVTAPFLSSFVTADRTNLKAKRRQQANNIGEYLSEKFKATDLAQIDASVGVPTPDPLSGALTYQIDNTKIPNEYGSKYTATVKLTPKSMAVNDDITPVPITLDASNSAIYMADFFKNDSTALNKDNNITHRKCIVTVDYNAAGLYPYTVTLSVKYCKGSDINVIYTANDVKLNYSNKPELYLFYTPFSGPAATDCDYIQIVSNVTDGVNIHLTKQSATTRILKPGYVKFDLNDQAGHEVHDTLETLNLSNKLQGVNYKIFTDLVGTGNLLQTHKVVSLYDMEVTVKYDGSKVLTYDSSKNDNK